MTKITTLTPQLASAVQQLVRRELRNSQFQHDTGGRNRAERAWHYVGIVTEEIEAATENEGEITPGSGKVTIYRRGGSGGTLVELFEDQAAYQLGETPIAVDERVVLHSDPWGDWWITTGGEGGSKLAKPLADIKPQSFGAARVLELIAEAWQETGRIIGVYNPGDYALRTIDECICHWHKQGQIYLGHFHRCCDDSESSSDSESPSESESESPSKSESESPSESVFESDEDSQSPDDSESEESCDCQEPLPSGWWYRCFDFGSGPECSWELHLVPTDNEGNYVWDTGQWVFLGSTLITTEEVSYDVPLCGDPEESPLSTAHYTNSVQRPSSAGSSNQVIPGWWGCRGDVVGLDPPEVT